MPGRPGRPVAGGQARPARGVDRGIHAEPVQLAALLEHDVGGPPDEAVGVARADAGKGFMLHGAMIIPSVRNDPDEIDAAWSPLPWCTSASAATSRAV